MIAARWAIRGIGIINTAILARLLLPDDFGLFAMGAITIQCILVFADAGQAMAVIRDVNATDEHFDTAWTMSVAIGAAVAAILFAIAPAAGLYFHEPRAVAVIRILALKPLLNGFTNVGVLAFRKNLHFRKDFQFLVIQRSSAFIIGISLALILQSYWALVAANIGGEALNVLLSYRLSPYRPRLRLPRLREIWAYSIWLQFANIGSFLGERLDQFTIGALAGTVSMGVYNVASDTASAPTDELVMPVARALFPFYATLVHQPARLAEIYLVVLSVVAVIGLSTGVGVALVADDLVTVLLGANWTAAAPLIVWLAAGNAMLAIGRSVNPVLEVIGNGRVYATRNWAFVTLLAPIVFVGGWHYGPTGVAAARAIVTLAFAPVMFYTVMRVIPVTAAQISARLWRPFIAALVMAAVIVFSGATEFPSAIVRLLVNSGLGAVTFAVTLLALWLVSGRQAGVEQMLVEQVVKLWRQSRRRETVAAP